MKWLLRLLCLITTLMFLGLVIGGSLSIWLLRNVATVVTKAIINFSLNSLVTGPWAIIVSVFGFIALKYIKLKAKIYSILLAVFFIFPTWLGFRTLTRSGKYSPEKMTGMFNVEALIKLACSAYTFFNIAKSHGILNDFLLSVTGLRDKGIFYMGILVILSGIQLYLTIKELKTMKARKKEMECH